MGYGDLRRWIGISITVNLKKIKIKMGVNSVEDQVNMSEVLKERLYFAPLPRVEDTAGVVQCLPKRATCFSTDSELVSISFPFLLG